MNLTYDTVKAAFQRKGYKFYAGHMNVNVFGIRSPERRANKFDDTLCVAFQNNAQNLCVSWPGTTDPGQHWLDNPLNYRGTAILVPGQYPVYAIDYHRGAYKALCQRRGPVKVYRDGNKDNILNYDPKTIQSGDFGINVHKSSSSSFVGPNSAGCQVFKFSADFTAFMNLLFSSEKIYGNKFTYTLFETKDFA